MKSVSLTLRTWKRPRNGNRGFDFCIKPLQIYLHPFMWRGWVMTSTYDKRLFTPFDERKPRSKAHATVGCVWVYKGRPSQLKFSIKLVVLVSLCRDRGRFWLSLLLGVVVVVLCDWLRAALGWLGFSAVLFRHFQTMVFAPGKVTNGTQLVRHHAVTYAESRKQLSILGKARLSNS
jgi:hypothetical protein